MASQLVLINGLPGAGKTTLAASLAEAMAVPLLSKDALKEELAADDDGLTPQQLGVTASELLWSRAAAQSSTVVAESWWYKPRDSAFVSQGLRRSHARRAIEIWCSAAVEVVRERYRSRVRNPLHRDHERLATDWEVWARNAEPLRLCPTILVDTSDLVEIDPLVSAVLETLPTSSLIP